jgi:hypothetical protein
MCVCLLLGPITKLKDTCKQIFFKKNTSKMSSLAAFKGGSCPGGLALGCQPDKHAACSHLHQRLAVQDIELQVGRSMRLNGNK